jgi:hypothetical protein
VLGVGDHVPSAHVFTAPHDSTTLEELVADRPVLLLFYLFDWSST